MSAVSPAAEKVAKWRLYPVTFVQEVLRATPEDWQFECLEAIHGSGKQRFALKASKGPGKSALLSWIGWWKMVCFPHPKCVATSISGDNLRDNLWTEFSNWQKRSELLKSKFVHTAKRIFAKDHPETWFVSARTWPKEADSNAQAETLAGIHADHVLFLVDEVGGIPDAVIATAEGGLANAEPGSGRTAELWIAGNPTQTSGPLWRACGAQRGLWWVKEISGDPDDPKRAKRVSITWARQQIALWGKDNPWVRVNVFGKFPLGQSNTLIGVQEAEDASHRKLNDATWIDAPKVLGIDVARFGEDRTVFYPRQGRMAFQPKVFRKFDTMYIAGQAALSIIKWEPDGVLIDQTGIGAGVVDRLRQMGYQVIGIDGSSSPLGGADMPAMINRRVEMWWKLADWLRTGGAIPEDNELIAELTAPMYKFTKDNELQLESKDDMKKRGIASPDKADALALTFAAPVQKKPFALPGAAGGSKAFTDYNPYG